MLQKDKDRLKTRDLIDGQREAKKKRDAAAMVIKQPGLRKPKSLKVAMSVRNLDSGRARSKSTHRSMRPRVQTQQYFETYKLRKIGDLRISGCMNDIKTAEIGGTFKENNYKKAKMEVKFKKKRTINHSRRIWNCTIHPPKSILDPITMKVKWSDKQEHGGTRTGLVIYTFFSVFDPFLTSKSHDHFRFKMH